MHAATLASSSFAPRLSSRRPFRLMKIGALLLLAWLALSFLVGQAAQPTVDRLVTVQESSSIAIVDAAADVGIDAVEVVAVLTGNEVASAHNWYQYSGCYVRSVLHYHTAWYTVITGYTAWSLSSFTGYHCIGS